MTGLGSPYSDRRRLQELETRVSSTLAQIERMTGRVSREANVRQVRLARTVAASASYPAEPANTFPIIFLDTEFPQAEGEQTPTYTERSEEYQAFAFNKTDRYLEEGTEVFVVKFQSLDGDYEWWIIDTVDEEVQLNLVRFTLTASLSPGGTASATVDACSGHTTAGTSITVEDFEGKFRGVSGYKGTAFLWVDDAASCNYSIIHLEHKALWVAGTTGSLSGGSATLTVSDYWHGNDPGASVTVVTEVSWHNATTAGTEIIAAYDLENDWYVPIEVPLTLTAAQVCPNLVSNYSETTVGVAVATDAIEVSKDSALRLFTKNADPSTVLIDIRPHPEAASNSLFYSADSGSPPRWSQRPQLGYGIALGTDAGKQGWLLSESLSDNVWGVASGLTTGTHYWLWPMGAVIPGGVGTGCHLVITKYVAGSPTCVGWDYSQRPRSGAITFQDYTGATHSITISVGLIISWTIDSIEELAYEADDTGITCTVDSDSGYDFCP